MKIIMKKIFSFASLAVGILGLGMFLRPVIEIICGVGGLLLSILGKESDAGMFVRAVRRLGRDIAWINIIWVCLEFGLKLAGFDIF